MNESDAKFLKTWDLTKRKGAKVYTAKIVLGSMLGLAIPIWLLQWAVDGRDLSLKNLLEWLGAAMLVAYIRAKLVWENNEKNMAY